MELENAIKHLLALGLWVQADVTRGYTETEIEAAKGITIARCSTPIGPVDSLEEVSLVFPHGNRWVYRHWDGVGGRADDDVHFETKSLADAIHCVENFYFGKPLQIDGWLFPSHKHPEWNIELLHDTFAKASSISEVDFHRIRHDRYRQFKEQVGAGPFSAIGVRFRKIEAIEPRPVALWLRNDLTEIYLVNNESE